MRSKVWLLVPVFFLLACGEDARRTPADEDPAPPPPAKEKEEPAPPKRDPNVLDVEAIEVPEDTERTRAARDRLVRTTIEARDVTSADVLRAMRTVPRHQFVPGTVRQFAYQDRPIPIGWDQTISQPYIVASMTEHAKIERDDTVLEIGTGSGYQAAVLAELTPNVYSIEIKEGLAKRAAGTLRGAGYEQVKVRHADGYYGWREKGPFDAILVTAAAPHVPPPLVRQLKPGGRMVIPVGSPFATQDLVLVTKDEEGAVRTRSLYPVVFVPLTGSLGEKDD